MAKTKKTVSKSRRTIYTVLIIIVAIISYFTEENITGNNNGKSAKSHGRHYQTIKVPNNSDTTQLVVMFYNLENFFDTINDPDNRYDNEYIPSGEKQWNTQRYLTKIHHLAQVFSNANKKELPDLIGVCEIENRRVLEDLLKYSGLKSYGYGIIHEESSDVRGIDLALIYNPNEFTPIEHKKIDIYYSSHRARTREILYIKGIIKNGDTLHIFLNHWKSRLSRGDEDSEYKRIAAAKSLKKAVKAVLKQNPNARIIIMGDFNDEPTNKSISQALGAKGYVKPSTFLFNAMYAADKNGEGTYNYKHKWLMFDNIIVSPNLTDHTQNLYLQGDGKVLKLDFLITEDSRGNEAPFRTFKGSKYLGGYSDHLPVEIVLKVKY